MARKGASSVVAHDRENAGECVWAHAFSWQAKEALTVFVQFFVGRLCSRGLAETGFRTMSSMSGGFARRTNVSNYLVVR